MLETNNGFNSIVSVSLIAGMFSSDGSDTNDHMKTGLLEVRSDLVQVIAFYLHRISLLKD